MRTVKINNIELGTGMPKICVPLTGRTKEQLLEDAVRAKTSGADLAEWRIDWFEDVLNIDELKRTGIIIKEVIGDMPLLITFRTSEEGGQREITKEDYENLLVDICDRRMAEMIDIEAFKDDDMVKRIITKAKNAGMITVGSNHDFEKTPSKEEIIRRLCKMQELDFDITKIALMPQKERDVLSLLDATLAMKETFADRPFITMSMTKKGLISRLAGECFGSCLTFGTAGTASAPGQIDAKELKNILNILHE